MAKRERIRWFGQGECAQILYKCTFSLKLNGWIIIIIVTVVVVVVIVLGTIFHSLWGLCVSVCVTACHHQHQLNTKLIFRVIGWCSCPCSCSCTCMWRPIEWETTCWCGCRSHSHSHSRHHYIRCNSITNSISLRDSLTKYLFSNCIEHWFWE